MILVIAKAGIAHPRHFRPLREPFGNCKRVVAVTLHAQRQGFDAGEDQKGVERGQVRPKIARAQYPASKREGKVTERFVKDNALIFGAWFRQHWIFLVARPIESVAVDDQSADRVAVATE